MISNEIDIVNDGLSLEVLTSKIKKIFDYYCQFGDRLNTLYLKPHKFQKLANDAELFDENFDKIRLELIYTTENKHKKPMDFPTFLNCLVKIAEFKFQGNNKQHRMNILLKNHIIPLYSFIFEKSLDQSDLDMNDVNKSYFSHSATHNKLNKDITLEKDTIELLSNSCPILFEIYKAYFPWEVSYIENDLFIKENSDKSYSNFLKEFDLLPALISRSLAYQIYQSEVNNFEFSDVYYQIIKTLDIASLRKYNTTNFLGKYFNFFHFIRMLCKISENGFEKIAKEFTQIEKITLTLERMELSDGFNNLDLKTHKTHSRNASFIIPKEVADNINLKIMDNYHTENRQETGREVFLNLSN